MNIKYLNSVLSIMLLSTPSQAAPIEDSYTICMPMHIDLQETGSFNVFVENESIDDTDTINIEFADSFTLKDNHGKDDITGYILNPSISFDANDTSTKTINYEINGTSVGSWQGNLNVNISLDKKAETNVIIDGPSLNEILKEVVPNTITFSHSDVDGEYLYDVSLAKDKSILLYENNGDVIITNKINEPIKANVNMENLFRDLLVSEVNNLNYIDMSSCKNMGRMFQMCKNITNLDVTGLDTSNVEDIHCMFDSMHALQYITGIETWDVSNVKTISNLFNDTIGLQVVPDITSWNITNKCTDISYVFRNVAYTARVSSSSKWDKTITYDYSGWDVSNVTNMSHAFCDAFSLKYIDLSGWDTSKVTDMSSMFEMTDTINKSLLSTVTGIEDWDVRNVKNMNHMFYDCRNLISDFSKWQPESVTDLQYAFYNTKKLNLRAFEDWDDIFNINNLQYNECFGDGAGNSVDKTYKPSWYE